MTNLTVCIPFHNNENTIDRLVSSIGIRTPNVMILDDASDLPFHKATYRFEVNGGVSRARNYMIDHVESEWIMFCDADDQLEYDWEDKVSRAIIQYPEADAIIFNYITQWEDESWSIEENRQFLHKPYCFGNLYKKEMLDRLNIRFYEDVRYLEDNVFTDMIQRYHWIQEINLKHSNECIYKHYFNPSGATNGHLDEIDFLGTVKNTAIARAYYYEDILNNNRPIVKGMFTDSDLGYLYSMYLTSATVDLDKQVFGRIIRALKQLYGDLTPSSEVMLHRSNEVMFYGVTNTPSIPYEEWLNEMES